MIARMTWNPTVRQLRQFGVCALIALPLLGWTMMERGAAVFAVLTGLGVLGGVLAWLRPAALKHPFIGLTLLTLPIGLVLGEVLLLAIYFGIFTPVALVFRVVGRDALKRRFEPRAASYWTPKTQAKDVSQYFRQS